MSSSASSFAPISIVIVAAEGEVTSPSAATIRMKFEAKLETLGDIRCQLLPSLELGGLIRILTSTFWLLISGPTANEMLCLA